MPRYVIKAGESLFESTTLDANTSKLTPEARQSQIREGLAARDSDKKFLEVKQYFSRTNRPYRARPSLVNELKILGTYIVDIPEEEAVRFSSEFPDLSVLPDDDGWNLIEPIESPLTEVKNDVDEGDLWHLQSVGVQRARQDGFLGSGVGVNVAVLDAGIEEHPELIGKILRAYEFNNSSELVQVGTTRDTKGHGTHVTGLICGNKVGVAPNANVINVLMLPFGDGGLANFITALEFAALQPDIQIVNVSAGKPGYKPEVISTVQSLLAVGVLPVVAVGNEGHNTSRSPGNYNAVVSVGASDKNGGVAGLSGGGTISQNGQIYVVPDLVAPGIDVYSANRGGGYIDKQGTSMASPIVSGIAALVIEKFPSISILELSNLLLSACKDLQLPADRQGKGLLQIPDILL